MGREEQLQAFNRLLDVMNELREKCPWDRKQTFDSLRGNSVEEVFELVEAIDNKDMQNIKKELGDVLLHIVFYAKMGDEAGEFDIADVCNSLCDKLIFRHPHVYGDIHANTPDEVKQNWEEIKLKEKNGNKTVLSGVPAALPALIKAHRIQDKARSIGFDWEERSQVWDKVREEIDEFQCEVDKIDTDKMEGEFGDVMFSLINAARLYEINPENALERTNKKFIKRFNYLEARAKEMNKPLRDMTLAEMDAIWNEAKKL